LVEVLSPLDQLWLFLIWQLFVWLDCVNVRNQEWDWEDSESETTEAMAMPALKGLAIVNCKLTCLPTGLASSKRHALRELHLYELSNLTTPHI
jgi:hypothetical protein